MQLPETFAERTKEITGEEYPHFLKALLDRSPVSIRINRNKDSGFRTDERVAWCETGYYLPERPLFTADPLFHAGCYYVQEASSMFLEQAIRQWVKHPLTALDLCAAPGGKSTHLSALLPSGSLLLSNEVIRSRAHILAENVCKWGNPSQLVAQNEPATIGSLQHSFDIVLADVPCSGEGMFRKDPQSIDEWSPENVRLCTERQRHIIRDIWPALKPGGLLLYSTCTYNTSENEDTIDWIAEELGAQSLTLDIPNEWNIAGSAKGNRPVYRFFPHRNRGEGFFMAILQKDGGEQQTAVPARQKKANNKPASGETPVPPAVKSWLNPSVPFHFFTQGNEVYAIPEEHRQTAAAWAEKLRLVTPGIHIATVKGKDIIPAHPLAMSTAYDRTAFPVWEVDKDTALRYLSKEAFNEVPSDLSKGYLAISYRNHLLGFIKNIGNRANNLYPQEWRIRMSLPKQPF